MEWFKEVAGGHWLEKTRIVAIVRGIPQESAEALADALYRGGIRVIEVTMNTPHASPIIEKLSMKYGETMWVGAGTVWNIDAAVAAHKAGAKFFVTPNVDQKVIEFGVTHHIPVICGALTPTEVVNAYQGGAAIAKIFPASSMGVQYFKELQGPLAHIPLMAVGGISADNAAQYMAAGAWGVGVGGNLVDKTAIMAKDFEAISSYAIRLVDEVNRSIQQ